MTVTKSAIFCWLNTLILVGAQCTLCTFSFLMCTLAIQQFFVSLRKMMRSMDRRSSQSTSLRQSTETTTTTKR